MEKVTKSYEILSENDFDTVLDEIQKNIETNHKNQMKNINMLIVIYV